MRWRNGVASGMRFARQGRIFDIVTVHDPDETGRYLVCRAREAGLMKLAMQLTLDGLIRALRLRAHAVWRRMSKTPSGWPNRGTRRR